MLKTQRNSIRILAPLCLLSLILSAILNSMDSSNAVWFSFGANIMIGVFASSLLALIISINSYYIEKRTLLEAYYRQVRKMKKAIAKYEYGSIDNTESLQGNLFVIEHLITDDLDALGDLYAKTAFLCDKKAMRLYLYGFYQYFVDISKLVSNNVRLLKLGIKDPALVKFIDSVLLSIDTAKIGESEIPKTHHKTERDLNEEMDILYNTVYGKKQSGINKTKQYQFIKTVIDDQIFKIEPKEYEDVIQELVEKVNEEGHMCIHYTSLSDIQMDYLWESGFINGKSNSAETDELLTIKVSEKTLNYFRFKKQYEKSKGII